MTTVTNQGVQSIAHWQETANLQTFANLELYKPQAEGRDKAMYAECQDIVDGVIDKLETVNNLVEFYWYARDKTGFSKDSINGLCRIITDCVNELKEAVKWE